ncbi:Carboxypeptidase S1 [Fulvia fulva]|uniref:Carboxypeptidase S1 n=1 Tax=Passalora fulva TaxID=5499 RepID=A0A9Q8L950_PASFU|nr:Carboxypeptidase S1 [Fulvia fulva]UJO13143.1 Carboxypeptidase S1 [Fulvia fulva]
MTQYGNDQACITAGDDCYNYVEAPLIAQKTYELYDVREPVATNPPETYVQYLSRADIQKQIGAKVNYTECAAGDRSPGYRLQLTGDNARTMLPYLENFVNRGIPTLIWAGDTDWICNWMGSLYVVDAVNFPGDSQFRNATLAPYDIAGKKVGLTRSKAPCRL